jgi:hypothetical protein
MLSLSYSKHSVSSLERPNGYLILLGFVCLFVACFKTLLVLSLVERRMIG